MLLDLVPIRRVADVTPPATVRSDPAPGRPDRLRWLPVGLTAPVTVLLAQSGG